MASSPITSWQIDGETMETVTDFTLLGSKITADDYCSHEIKRRLLLGRKAMTNLNSILKSRAITLPTKFCLILSSQCYDFSSSHVWLWELDYKESWAPENWCFELWCWRRFFRVPWTARRSNQSTLKQIIGMIHWKDWGWSWNSNILATWCEELTHWKRPWCWERLKAGEGDDRGWDHWMASPTQWTWVWTSSRRWWRTGKPGVLQSMGSQSWTRLCNWTELNSWYHWVKTFICLIH